MANLVERTMTGREYEREAREFAADFMRDWPFSQKDPERRLQLKASGAEVLAERLADWLRQRDQEHARRDQKRFDKALADAADQSAETLLQSTEGLRAALSVLRQAAKDAAEELEHWIPQIETVRPPLEVHLEAIRIMLEAQAAALRTALESGPALTESPRRAEKG